MKFKPNLKLPSSQLPFKQENNQHISDFSEYVDPSGKLNFEGKAILHSNGVDFASGKSFKININDIQSLETLGKGNYGTVYKVLHLPTKVIMAMKETRVELDKTKLGQILMELNILHNSNDEHIVEFYGAFFMESNVYYCMEYMDAGSLDLLCHRGCEENILAKITVSIIKGLKFLKEEHSIIHRDVKPTNILVNMKGKVKLCDFGVSGQLIMSLAKTHIGCQSYMAPERITSSAATPYSVQSDIWSLGISTFEIGTGVYPYSNEKYDSVFSRINAIVVGEIPKYPKNKFSNEAQLFVDCCLRKEPQDRPSYNELIKHEWFRLLDRSPPDMEEWVKQAYNTRKMAVNDRE